MDSDSENPEKYNPFEEEKIDQVEDDGDSSDSYDDEGPSSDPKKRKMSLSEEDEPIKENTENVTKASEAPSSPVREKSREKDGGHDHSSIREWQQQSWRSAPWRSSSQHWKLAVGIRNVNSLEGKELALVGEVEKYQLDIVGLTATNSVGTGTKFLNRGWYLAYSGVPPSAMPQSGVGILTSPWLQSVMLDFYAIDERVSSVRLQVVERSTLTVVCVCGPSNHSEYSEFLENVASVLHRVPSTDSIVVLGDFNAFVGKEGDPCKSPERGESLPDLKANGEMFQDFCSRFKLTIINSRLEEKHQRVVAQKSMLDYLVVSADLKPLVGDPRVIIGPDLPPEERLMISWIQFAGREPDRSPGRVPIRSVPDTFVPSSRGLLPHPRIPSGMLNIDYKPPPPPSVYHSSGPSYKRDSVPKEPGVDLPRALWWTPEVSEAVRLKKDAFRAMLGDTTPQSTARYRQAKKAAQRAVSDAKYRARDAFDRAVRK